MAPAPSIGNSIYRAMGAACLALTLISSVVSPHSSKNESLLAAAEKGDSRKVKALLDDGVPVDCRNIISIQAIHEAAKAGDLELVRLLLARGARIDAPDARGNTPLDKAVRCGGDGDEAVKVLLKRGAGLHGPRARDLAVRAAELDDVEILRLLLDRGIDLNTCDERGFHLLHAAARCQQPLVSLLLERGARPDVVDDRGKQPIHTAAVRDNLRGVKALLAAGARIDARDHEGRQPIHDAAEWGRLDMVRFSEHGCLRGFF